MNWRLLQIFLMHLVFYIIIYFSEFGPDLAYIYMMLEILLMYVFHMSENSGGVVWIRGYNGRLKRSEDFYFSDRFPFFIRFFLGFLEQLIAQRFK